MASSPPQNNDTTKIKKRKRGDDEDSPAAITATCTTISSDDDKLPKSDEKSTFYYYSSEDLLDALPPAIIQHSVFPFLSTNTLTLFAGVSRCTAALVEDYRIQQHHPIPCYIFRQQLLPVKMSYINFQRGMRRLPGEPFDVHIAQTVRFLVQSQRHGVVQLEFCLTEYLWTELNGTRRYRGLANEDRCVWVEVKIFRKVFQKEEEEDGSVQRRLERVYESTPPPQHPRTGATCASYFLEGYDNNPSDTALYFFHRQEFEQRQQEMNNLTVPQDVQDNQKACVEYVWLCANRIASSPAKYNFPNLHYIVLSALPKELYKYLPDPTFAPDPSKAVGPKLFPRWKPRFPNNPEQWHGFLRQGNTQHDMYGQLKKDFLIHEVPWYSEWYPKPTILKPSNLLGSLPDSILVDHIAPFLDLATDFPALKRVLPRLETHYTQLTTVPAVQ